MDNSQSRSQAPLMGIVLLILITVVGGIVLGGIVAVISTFIYLIIAFPILMAWAGGKLVTMGLRWGKVRSRGMAILFGLLIGLTIYGTYRYGEYLLARQQILGDLGKQYAGQATPAELDHAIDVVFQQKTGQTGFVGFTILRAQVGEKLSLSSSTGSSSSADVTLPEPLTWIYWLVEILIVAGGAAAVAAKATEVPYCDQDNRFFVTQSLGRVPNASANQFISAVKASDWSQANGMIDKTRNKISYPYLEVKVDKCPACNTNPLPFRVIRKRSSRSNNDSTLFKGTLTPAQYDQLSGSSTMPVGAVLA